MLYLASPYSHPDPLIRNRRFEEACRTAAILMNQGEIVFSPIAHTHPIAVLGKLPTGWEFWERFDWEFIGFCTELMVLTLDGWKESKGVKAEIEIARKMAKPISFCDRDGNKMAVVMEER